jgi:hypothetical protein
LQLSALSESAIRPIDICTLRDILVVISKKAPIKRGELAKVCTDVGILGPGRKRAKLSSGRINHYVAVMRCMRFVRLGRFFTLKPPYGESLIGVAHFRSAKLYLDEQIEFAEGLFRCETTKNLLGLFADGTLPSSYQDFLNRASTVYLRQHQGVIELGSASLGKKLELRTKKEIMAVRWGPLQLAINVGAIDEIRVRPSEALPEEYSHIVFPVDLMRTWTVNDFEKLVESLIMKWGDGGTLSIPELVYRGCLSGRISHTAFQELLNELYEKERTRFYFDRVPITTVEGYEKAYPRIGGQYRSLVRLVEGDRQ